MRLRADRVGQSGKTLGDVASRYKGHPYAIQAALDIVKKTGRIEGLPSDPTPEKIAESQWQQVCQDSEAIRLFEAYAILEVGVPADVVVAVSDLDGTSCKRLHSDTYLRGLLRDDGHGQRIYHAILADHILGEMREDEKSQYHRRAADFYRTRLKQAKDQQTAPDVLAAARLAEHVLSPEGNEAFVTTFTDECGQALINLGLFDEFIGLSQRALKAVETGSAKEAMLLGNLGLVYQKRSDLDEAEKMFEKALDIEKKLGRLEGVANNYGNLGVIHRIRGDLDRAQVMHTKALEIDQKLERHHSVGAHYGNLGLIHKMRGDLDQAEKTLKKALEILGQIGNLQGVADVSGNLGLLYQDRGDLDRADQMHKKSLEINEKLGRLEGMANQYGNLGLVCQGRGDLDGAEAMHEKSIQINEKLGRLEGTASQYGNLGLVYRKRGDLDAAEEMHKKSLEIAERLGRPEVMALQYGNLGNVYFTRGDLDQADKMYRRALEIDERLGMLGGMAGEYTNLGLICLTRGDTGKAREYWAKAVELYKKTGMPHMVAKVQGLLDGLPQEQE